MTQANPTAHERARTGTLLGVLLGGLLLIGLVIAAVLIGAVVVLGATTVRPADVHAVQQPALEAR